MDNVARNKGVGEASGGIPTRFQTIVDTYGVPRYQEFNPAVPTIVTFPFLFGVMYGDMFHASFLFLFALSLVFGKRLMGAAVGPGGSLEGMYEARYVLLFMGFFALYCGLMYNDAIVCNSNKWCICSWY